VREASLAFNSSCLAFGFWLLAFGSWLLALGFWQSAVSAKVLQKFFHSHAIVLEQTRSTIVQ
jgi:hypothetical protein